MLYLRAVTEKALGKATAIALATLLMLGLVLLRELTGPSGDGYWAAMAPAPGGGVYLADKGHLELRLVQPSGSWRRLGAPLPDVLYRALAADGPNLLLATEGHLYPSNDLGGHWRPAIAGRFTAVAVRGSFELAAAWAQGLYYSEDAGAHWARAAVPAGDTEFESVLASGYAATLLGLLRSTDGGLTWTPVPGIPDRVTAVDDSQGQVRAGDWRGRVWSYDPAAGTVTRVAAYTGGVESLAGPVVATTGGPVPDRPGPLHGREVTRVVATASGYFAAVAVGPLYHSADGLSWTLAYQG